MQGILSHIQTVLLGFGLTIITICLIIVGLKTAAAGEGGIRKGIQGLGGVLFGALIVGGAAAIAGGVMALGKGF